MKTLGVVVSLLLLASGAFAEGEAKGDTHRQKFVFSGNGTAGPYVLVNASILSETEVVELDGRRLVRGVDYTMDYKAGTITFRKPISATSSITATYEFRLADLKLLEIQERTKTRLKITADGTTIELWDSPGLTMAVGAKKVVMPSQSNQQNIIANFEGDVRITVVQGGQTLLQVKTHKAVIERETVKVKEEAKK
jgi:hypothetical protein